MEQCHWWLTHGATLWPGRLWDTVTEKETQLRDVAKEWEPQNNRKVRNKGDQHRTNQVDQGCSLLQANLQLHLEVQPAP